MTNSSKSVLLRLVGTASRAQPHEFTAALLAFACNFILLASYYILRPLRDTMATVFGVQALQSLFTGTFIITLVCAPVFAWCASKMKLARLLPGVFWILLINLLIFCVLFRLAPQNRWLAASFFWWFSVVNLFLISIFWTFMADVFAPAQAMRLFAFIAAGGSLGAIAGPLLTRSLVGGIGISGLLLMAGAGFLCVIGLIHALMREKEKLRAADKQAQQTTLDHSLPGNPLRGFALLLKSPFLLNQAAFMLLMTWIATIFYFLQTDIITKSFPVVESRAIAFADVDLFVNICSAIILVFGMGRILQRFGVTVSLLLTPVLMIGACLAIAVAPSFFLIQASRAIQRISQYAVARPSREVLFTVVDQQSKYKAKNVIDTAVYRFGDLSSAWMLAGLRAAGFGLLGAMTFGIGVSAVWGVIAVALGRRYEALAGSPGGKPATAAAE
jgi:AAA family ATP:ADP antiporter